MFKKALPVAMAAAALVTLAGAPASAAAPVAPASAAASAVTVPRIEILPGTSLRLREPNSVFVCPEGEVLTGRDHKGDENGWTTYWCGRIVIDGEPVFVKNGGWSPTVVESSSRFSAFNDRVILGRRHDGDENGLTQYFTGTVHWRDTQVRVASRRWTTAMKESDHLGRASYNEVMIGRWHNGDENGDTFYEFGKVALTVGG
ncbi:hypothetical protein [Streptosporangium sp. NPDC003464]